MQVNGPQSTGYVHGPQGLSGPHSARGTHGAQPTSQPAADQLDISPAAAQAAEAADATAGDEGVRADLVARIRGEIADGTYESVDKITGAVDRLFDEVG